MKKGPSLFRDSPFLCNRMQDHIIISPSLETLLNRIREMTVKMETTVARAHARPSVALATAL